MKQMTVGDLRKRLADLDPKYDNQVIALRLKRARSTKYFTLQYVANGSLCLANNVQSANWMDHGYTEFAMVAATPNTEGVLVNEER